MNKPITPLSASRMKTAQSCSWLYWAKYKMMLPDTGNDGSSRGTVCHLVFETLGDVKKKKHYDKIMETGDVFASKVIKNLVTKEAKRLNVADEANMTLIKEMILNGLRYDFFGHAHDTPHESHSEKDFEIVVMDDDKRYKIKGFIDKLFLYKDSKHALIRDFKTSKGVFKGKELTDNLQDYMYSLAVRHLYPEYTSRISEFLFLKFDLTTPEESQLPDFVHKVQTNAGLISMSPIDPDDLEGFEYQLTAMQDYLDNFNEEDAKSNFAYNQPYPTDDSFSGPLLCGRAKFRGELKKDGSPMWHCPMKHPFDFYVILNDAGKVVKSYHEHEFSVSLVEEGQTFEKRSYNGCPRFYRK